MRFEPEINSGPDADEGEIQIQKACRLLALAHEIDDLGEYYGAILEHSFIVIEHTLQGDLLAVTGVEPIELRDHDSPYDLAKGQVPLGDDTIESLKRLYGARRTSHYYGTTVTTADQAERMRTVATRVHEHIVTFEPELDQFCPCSSSWYRTVSPVIHDRKRIEIADSTGHPSDLSQELTGNYLM